MLACNFFDDKESQEACIMSEQEIEPSAPNAGIKKSSLFQEKNRFSQSASAGGIQARTIRAQNVVVGTQINYGSSEPSWKQTPPLQRLRRAEHFTDRETERARLLADLKPGRIVTVCGPGGM